MNKAIIAIVTLVVVAAGAGGLFFVLNNDDDSDTDQQTNSQANNTVNQTQNPVDNAQQTGINVSEVIFPYTVTADFTDGGANSQSLVVEVENRDRSRTVIKAQGIESEFIAYDGDLYSKSNGKWTKFPTGDTSNSVDYAGIYSADNENFKSLYDRATFKGTESCGSDTCSVYTSVDPDGQEVTVKVVESKNLIYAIEGVKIDGQGSGTVQFDYDSAVNVTPPTDFEEFDLSIPTIPGVND